MANSDHPNDAALARELLTYLRWRNANNRHADVLAAQRREPPASAANDRTDGEAHDPEAHDQPGDQ